MSQRYFADELITTDHAILTGPEAHHLQHVMRAAVGDHITLFDGSGREFQARIDSVKRAQIELTITASEMISREADRKVTVGVTLPKGDRQRWLIEKLTELGVAEVVPLRSERSTVHLEPRSLKKLNRFVVEASKQCGRNQLMRILPPANLPAFLAAAPPSALRWCAEPKGSAASRKTLTSASAYLAVGPEGGFSPQELQVARAAGWDQVSLGPRILRIETACAVLATLVLCQSDASG